MVPITNSCWYLVDTHVIVVQSIRPASHTCRFNIARNVFKSMHDISIFLQLLPVCAGYQSQINILQNTIVSAANF